MADASEEPRHDKAGRLTAAQRVIAAIADPTTPGYVARQQEEARELAAGIGRIARVRSGGQTGADRGGLDAARACGVPICGWCPPGGLAEDHLKAPGLLADYPELKEAPTGGYVGRTALNVRDSHATLIVAPDGLEPRSGTEMTARFAEAYGRPCLVVAGAGERDEVLGWLEGLGSGLTLNVAGPRESKCPGVHDVAYELVRRVLLALGGREGGQAS